MAQGLQRTYDGKKLSPAITPDTARTQAIKLPPNVYYVQGTVLGELTASPGVYAAYTSGASDGSQNPKAILEYNTSTNAAGEHFNSPTAGVGHARLTTSAYITGIFRTGELVQSGAGALDANAVTKMGRIVEGSLTLGLLALIG